MIDESPAANRQWLLIGPWDHYGTRTTPTQCGGRDFGPSAFSDTREGHLRFFDRWLKGIDNGQEQDPRVRIFIMGTNQWRDEKAWPPAGMVEAPFYLHSDGAANTLAGNGRLGTEKPAGDEPGDTLVYDPDDPTPSYQDLSQYPPTDVSFDKRWQLRRDDVLVYTSESLEQDLEITGHPFLVLYATSDCPDTDWHVGLHDVHPDGRSEELTHGCMRAAHRHGLMSRPTPIEPGKVYEYRIELMATSNVWKAGHRVRIAVASADYPAGARNPNTNAPTGDDDRWQIAHNIICHTAEYPSHLLAPVVKGRG
jgi:putative CocE/NonD family hydrolase